MTTNYCEKKCCVYTTIPYKTVEWNSNDGWMEPEQKIKKSGAFIYDGNTKKILLVQSRGQFFGCPKGSLNPGETVLECAIREVKEETGIDFEEKDIKGEFLIKGKAMYYLLDIPEKKLLPQDHIKDNDANSIGYFFIDCIRDLIKSGKFSINLHCKLLIKKVFDIDI
jgi:ADP-ribose pyrophosphatase YjhB (NUDIX family)